MAKQLVWSPEAVEDLEHIAHHIERDSAHYARAVVSQIVAKAESIPENPKLGRVVPELSNTQYRERFIHKYRVIYRIGSNRILLIAIIHGSQDFEKQTNRIQDFGDSAI